MGAVLLQRVQALFHCLVTKSSSTVPYNYTKPFPVQDAVVSIGYFAMDLQTILQILELGLQHACMGVSALLGRAVWVRQMYFEKHSCVCLYV